MNICVNSIVFVLKKDISLHPSTVTEKKMKNAIEIGKNLDLLKVKNFVDIKNAIVRNGETMTEIWFPKYTDADKAIMFLNSKGIENSGRESNKNRNDYYKFKTEIYL